jgi:hypothetical protein
MTLCTLQIQLQLFSKDKSQNLLTSSCEGPELPSSSVAVVGRVADVVLVAAAVPHGLEGWRIDRSHGTKIDIGKILNTC